ncbi:MAG: hypothetical protein JXR65_00535 [Bacteroidales bacterium]|nr:hypothetical protein [Bacteroidales bacterium]
MEISIKHNTVHFTLREACVFLTSFLFFCLPKILLAQQEQEKELMVFSGKVMEADRKKAVPDVQIISRNTLTGTFSEPDGSFQLLVSRGDSLLFTRLGYAALRVGITDSLLALDSIPVFYLKTDTIQMHELIIRGYPNYQIFKQRIANMKQQTRYLNLFSEFDKPRVHTKPYDEGVHIMSPLQTFYNLYNSEAVLERKLIRNRRRYNRNMIKLGRPQDTIASIPDYRREKIR